MEHSQQQILREQELCYRLYYEEGKKQSEISEETGLSIYQVFRRIKGARKAAKLDPKIRDHLYSKGFGDLLGIHSGWIPNKDENGVGDNIYFFLGRDEEKLSGEEFADLLADTLRSIPPAPKIARPEKIRKNRLNFFGLADFHMGASIKPPESERLLNPTIAEENMRRGFSETHGTLGLGEKAIIYYNGDTTHANDDSDTTFRSKHHLKVEGSHYQNVQIVIRIAIWQIEMALKTHKKVIFAIKKGNHDPNTPGWVIAALAQRYRNNKHVELQDPENPWFSHRQGRIFLCGHHGHGVKPAQLAYAAPKLFRHEWGQADFHRLYTGHCHNDKSETFGGLIWKQLPAITQAEQHSTEMGYADTSALYAAGFDTLTGKTSEITVQI